MALIARRKRTPALALMGLLSACANDCTPDDPAGSSGELGNGQFIYECLGESDAICRWGYDAYYPDAIADEGRFRLRYDPDGTGSATVESASDYFLTESYEGFRAERPGVVSVLAVAGDGEIIDLKHIQILSVQSLEIEDEDGADITSVAIDAGDEVDLWAVPRSLDGEVLAGELDYDWTLDAAGEVEFVTSVDSARIRIRGLNEGIALVTAEHDGVSKSVEILVEGSLGDGDGDGDGDGGDDGATDGPGDFGDGTGGGDGDGDGDADAGGDGDGDGDGDALRQEGWR